jgi:hypothetical protein
MSASFKTDEGGGFLGTIFFQPALQRKTAAKWQ